MPYACKFCIAEQGLKGSEVSSLPETLEELYNHIESAHHIPLTRPGETEEQSADRLARDYPESSSPDTCKCPVCKQRRKTEELLKTNADNQV